MKEYNQNLYNVLKKYFKIIYFNNNISKEEIIIRCPYCGDSIKNPHHGHFYINNFPPYAFFCQRCNASGILTEKFFSDLNIYDQDIYQILSESKKIVLEQNNFDYLKKKEIKVLDDIKIPPPKYTNIEKRNLEYLNARLETNFTFDDIETLKLILNFKEFIFYNNLKHFLDYNVKKVETFNLNYIGFLNFFKNIIIFRNISNLNDANRYTNWVIKETENLKTFPIYAIKNEIDLLNVNFTLNLVEGVFDAIGLWNYLDRPMITNNVFIAACGNNFRNIIETFLRFGFLNMEVNLYSDSDFLLNDIERNNISIKKIISLPIKKLNIYYNTSLEKNKKTDFGVPKRFINIKEMKI